MSQVSPLNCSYRSSEDDFFCEKYGVWYALEDCNFRVLHRTYEGCVNCFQGRVNLRSPQAARRPDGTSAANLLAFPASDPLPPVAESTPRKR